LVRFPPHKQIASTLISDTTYFKMKKEGVLVSLKAWTRDIDPYDILDEVWVQVSGIPPQVEQLEDIQASAFLTGKDDGSRLELHVC
jgi:hypothetical protein